MAGIALNATAKRVTRRDEAEPSVCGVSAAERAAIVEDQRRQVREKGITDRQTQLGDGWLSRRLYTRIAPDRYPNGAGNVASRVVEFVLGDPRVIEPHPAEDAWATYLGLPQRFGLVEISDDVPTAALGGCDDPHAEFYRLSNAQHGEERLVNRVLRDEKTLRYRAEHGDDAAARALEKGVFKLAEYEFAEPLNLKPTEDGNVTSGESALPPTLGTFTATLGRDERGDFVTYDDLWDLDPSVGPISVPFELIAGNPIVFSRKIYFDRAKAERVIELEDELSKGHHDYRFKAEMLERLVERNPDLYPREPLEELRSLDPRYRAK